MTHKLTLLLSLLFLGCAVMSHAQHISDYVSIAPLANDETFQYPSDSHTFQYLIEHGDPLTAGGTLPDNCDFTGYIPIAGSSTNGYLGINSERTSGGVTMLDINFNALMKKWEITASEKVDFTGVSGTSRNCSGAVTPWNTYITCEENIASDVTAPFDGYNDYGWCVEIDPATRMVVDQGGAVGPDKLWSAGNFRHENLVVHANERTVYQGADSNPGYLYKYVTDVAQNLGSGSLYVYRDLTAATGEWVLLNNTTIAEKNSTLTQSASVGAKVFNAIEDVEISPIDGMVYFAVKNEDKVYRFQDSDPITGTTVSNFETYVGDMNYDITHAGGTTSTAWGTGNDNLAFDDLGNLWVYQDGSNDYIWTVMIGHTQAVPDVKLFGISPLGAEPTGITFSPDFKYIFMAIQHPSSSNSSVTQTDAFNLQKGFDKDVTLVMGRIGTLGSINLPVELSYFSAKEERDHAMLEWETASEVNSSHFLLERSTDAKNWSMVAKITSAHNTLIPQQYSYRDYNLTSGIYYYRLKMVDLDDTYRFSEIEKIYYNKLIEDDLLLRPNPFHESISLIFPYRTEGEITISLINILGNKVAEYKKEVISSELLQLDLKHLATGTYFMSIKGNDYKIVRKVIKK